MTPRENMRRAITFDSPERLPINGYDDTFNDVIGIACDEVLPPQADGRTGVDQWLCQWAYTDMPNMGQVKGHPLEDLRRMDAFPWPDADDPRRYAGVPAQFRAIEIDPVKHGRYRVTWFFMLLWERMQALHGFENCMIAMMEDTPEIHELADRITAYDIGVIRNLYRLGGAQLDSFNFSDDWGTETDLMVSPALFRSFFYPRYQRIFQAAHDCGWQVWMHSCGKINKAIPHLIEAGVNVLNMQQPLANGIEEIGRDFSGKVCFETLCDIQRTLPRGDRAEIAAQAEALMRQWGTPTGGFILGDYGDAVAIGADPMIKSFMLETFRKQDPWRQRRVKGEE